jgi:hypothetical protein
MSTKKRKEEKIPVGRGGTSFQNSENGTMVQLYSCTNVQTIKSGAKTFSWSNLKMNQCLIKSPTMIG